MKYKIDSYYVFRICSQKLSWVFSFMVGSMWSNMNIYDNIWLKEEQRGIIPSVYLWEYFALRFANKSSSNGTQALAIIDTELWKIIMWWHALATR